MEHFRVITSKEHEHAKEIFVNTVTQFKNDLIYLQGCLAIMKIEHEKTRFISVESLDYLLEHLFQMQEMLNDFNVRLTDAQNF